VVEIGIDPFLPRTDVVKFTLSGNLVLLFSGSSLVHMRKYLGWIVVERGNCVLSNRVSRVRQVEVNLSVWRTSSL
jgi:hypothetical protein